MTEDDLYDILYRYLEQQQWRQADEVTYRLMLHISDRTAAGWLRTEDILNFPCSDLRTLDGLWVYHSRQRFGFSVQRSIYQQLQDNLAEDEEIWPKFATKVGWYVADHWLTYPELTFYLSAPVGHLPRYVTLHLGLNFGDESQGFEGQALWHRLQFCEEAMEDWIDDLDIPNEV